MTSKDAMDDLVKRLREANQHLVIATVRAQELQAEAEAANNRQREFLCMLAHELRNPLAPLGIAAELLGMITTAHPKLPKLHGVIARQVNSLNRLVGDLLDASRVSSGKFTLKMQTLLLSEVIESAIEISQPVLDLYKQELHIDLPSDPILLDGDLMWLGQVFSNLLINAAKFTPGGGHVTISAARTDNSVTVSVKDDGIGVAPELQPFVFDLFAQAPHAGNTEHGGLGIGLSLVRSITEMHGGMVEIHSEGLGCGCEFKVLLPAFFLPTPRAMTTLSKPLVTSRPCRILMIGDNANANANAALKQFLKLQGHTVRLAPDDPTGLLLAREYPYDVIIYDAGLADIESCQTVRQLNLHEPEREQRYIALVFDASKADQVRAAAAGFDDYLIKPVETSMLSRLLMPKTVQ